MYDEMHKCICQNSANIFAYSVSGLASMNKHAGANIFAVFATRSHLTQIIFMN